MSLTVIGTHIDIYDLFDVFIDVSGKLYTLSEYDQDGEPPATYSYDKFLDDLYEDEDDDKQYRVCFPCWRTSSIGLVEGKTLEEVKERFPEWANDIELSLLQDLL